jgi:ubiquinone/menaquinone biosynthesis C-methylase UbiE
MVSLRQTSLKYHGEKAKTYDAVRTKQARWDVENQIVGGWLAELKPKSVLDCPVGTGRFIADYVKLGCDVLGMDISDEMIELAEKKQKKLKAGYVRFQQGSATETGAKDKAFDGSVVVRFLDLIDEDAMRAVVTEMARVSRRFIICTIRLGEKYVPKSNTAEHDAKKFRALVKRLGFKIEKSEQFRQGSWHILLLKRG